MAVIQPFNFLGNVLLYGQAIGGQQWTWFATHSVPPKINKRQNSIFYARLFRSAYLANYIPLTIFYSMIVRSINFLWFLQWGYNHHFVTNYLHIHTYTSTSISRWKWETEHAQITFKFFPLNHVCSFGANASCHTTAVRNNNNKKPRQNESNSNLSMFTFFCVCEYLCMMWSVCLVFLFV